MNNSINNITNIIKNNINNNIKSNDELKKSIISDMIEIVNTSDITEYGNCKIPILNNFENQLGLMREGKGQNNLPVYNTTNFNNYINTNPEYILNIINNILSNYDENTILNLPNNWENDIFRPENLTKFAIKKKCDDDLDYDNARAQQNNNNEYKQRKSQEAEAERKRQEAEKKSQEDKAKAEKASKFECLNNYFKDNIENQYKDINEAYRSNKALIYFYVIAKDIFNINVDKKIKKVWTNLLLKIHPNKHGDEKLTKKINNIYETKKNDKDLTKSFSVYVNDPKYGLDKLYNKTYDEIKKKCKI